MAEAVMVGDSVSKLSDIIMIKKSGQFKSRLVQLQETITKIENLNKVLDRPTQETSMFNDQLKLALDLVRKCKHIKWNPYKKYRHLLKLNDMNASLVRLDVQLQQTKDLKEMLVMVKDVQDRMEKGSSSDRSSGVVPKILEPPREIVENREMDAPSETLQLEVLNSHEQAMLTSLELNHLKIPLDVIKICTQNFNEGNYIGKGGYGRVYKGMLSWANHENQPVAVKRLDATGYQGNKEFYTEVMMLSQYRHENVITLIGFCHYKKEMILVYEYASHGSLDTYIKNATTYNQLSWPQLLEICVGVASALDYLHNRVAATHRIIHRDIKSANILLDENWKAKLSDFGLSRIGLANQNNSFVVTNFAGTLGYCDPQYHRTGILTKESDVFSFGVVLFEVLCGRLACVLKYNDERRFLYQLARTYYKNGEVEKIMDERIKEDSKPRTLSKISYIAYQCLQETRAERPTIAEVLLQLKQAKEIQMEANVIGTSFEHSGT